MEYKLGFDVIYKFCLKIFLAVIRTERNMNEKVHWS